MASPQLENGYTRIANELLDEFIRTPLSGRYLRVWLFVLRKTYGFRKKRDKIPLSQFTRATRIDRSSVCKIIKKLVAWRTLEKEKNTYSINKNYETWVVVSTPHSGIYATTPSGVEDNLASGVDATLKRKKTKEIRTKERRGNEPDGSQETPKNKNSTGTEIIIKAFEEVDPKNKTYYANITQRSACDFLLKEYGLEKVKEMVVIIQATNQLPYFPKIHTPHELKERWKKVEDMWQTEKVKIKSKQNYVL